MKYLFRYAFILVRVLWFISFEILVKALCLFYEIVWEFNFTLKYFELFESDFYKKDYVLEDEFYSIWDKRHWYSYATYTDFLLGIKTYRPEYIPEDPNSL